MASTKTTHVHRLTAGASLAALMTALAMPAAAQDTPVETDQATEVEEIVITGFRSSLSQALNEKRNEAGAIDMILAEDMADFPDLNLAESIQRLPGVTIERDYGQGRTISVRGLSSEFTRVRINGLEAQAAGGGNRSRSFDFSVFASELFNSITVRKTQSAEIEEGSLGATVDLQTGQPLAYGAGFNAAASVQGSYNDLSEATLPRMAGLLSWTNDSETFGALVSVAYSERNPISESFNTTRWAQGDPNVEVDPEDMTPEYPYGFGQNFGGCIPCTTDAERDAVLTGWYPRIPRYTFGESEEDRLGITASFQWRPTDRTEMSLDLLHSEFNQAFESPKVQAMSFSRATPTGVREMEVVDYELDANGNIVYGVFNNVDIRSENGFTQNESTFDQITLNVTHEFSDRLRGRLKIGRNEAESLTPTNISYQFDIENVDGYSYDFRQNDRLPSINYGVDVSYACIFALVEWRSNETGGVFDLESYGGALEYDLNPGWTLQFGGEFRTYGFDTWEYRRNTAFGAGSPYRQLDVTGLGKLVSLDGDMDIPAGSDLTYITPDIWAITDWLDLYENFPLSDNPSSIRNVQEEDTGVFVQLDFDQMLGSMPVRGNLGIRYARTETASRGYLGFVSGGGEEITVDNEYDDVLPSFNLALDLTPDLVARFGAAKVMARPSLGNLTPGGSVDTSNQRVNYGNPLLDPFRATNFDASLEWYFAPEALLAVAVFYKDIESFSSRFDDRVPWSELGLPDEILDGTPSSADMIFDVSRIINGEGGELYGLEIQYQQPFTFLPGFWQDFGFIGNYTYVQSEVNYGDAGSNRLTGQSDHTANATLYYERDRLEARVSAAYRGDYLLSFPGGNGNSEEGIHDSLHVDASMSYDLTDNFTLSLEGINLTDEYQDRYVDVANRVSNYRHFGREIIVGLRWRY